MSPYSNMADIMMKVAFSTDVTSLATAVAGLCKGFESPSAVEIQQGEVHVKRCVLLQGLWQWEHVNG
jgi:hypothetical protein